MKIILIYYTGTYNSRYLTLRFKEKLKDKGHSVDTIEIDINTKQVDLKGYDLVGFSYPIYAFSSPKVFDDYVKKLKLLPGQKCFIYKQSGEMLGFNNASSRFLKSVIKKRKAILINERHYPMPYNIIFKFKDECVKQELLKNDKGIDVQIYEIEHGINHIIKSNMFYNFIARVLYIQRLGAKINSYFYHVKKDKCIDCNLCIKSCPMNNIYRDKNNHIKFHHNCMMCMRCSFYCPKDAISIGIINGLRINGDYKLNQIKNDDKISSNYVNEKTKGFFKCYKKTYNEIDQLHKKYFKE